MIQDVLRCGRGRLLIRPKMFQGESVSGYTLRLAEDNGYPSMHVLLAYEGLDELTIRSNTPTLKVLAELVGPNQLDANKHDIEDSRSTKQRTIHGEQISTIYLNKKNPKICPECIAENGYIKYLFDLKYYVACSKHNKYLINICDSCQTIMSWNRPGILKCKCQDSFSPSKEVLSSEIANVMSLLEWKFEKGAFPSRLIKAGYPESLLQNVSPTTLLYIIQRLTHVPFLHIHDTKFIDLIERSIEALDAILMNWPEGFYRYLEQHVESDESSTLTAKFRTFNKTFCVTAQKNKPIDFLHDQFIKFGNDHWKMSAIDARSLSRAQISGQVLGKYSLANHLNLRVPTINNFIKAGVIKGHAIEGKNKNRIIFYLDEIPFSPWDGPVFTQKEAARYLRIPTGLLKLLHKKRILIKEHLARGTLGFAQIDLDNFQAAICRPYANNVSKLGSKLISLKTILAKKQNNQEFVAMLLDAVKKRNVAPTFGDSLPDLHFEVNVLNQFCHDNNYPAFGTPNPRNYDLF